jgi:hypothetical protein
MRKEPERLFRWTAALFSVVLCIHGQERSKSLQQNQQGKVPIEVGFCQIVAQPGLYDGKEVFVQATYNGGYEWSVLESADCSSDKNLVWLESSNDNVREVIKLGPKRESVRFDLRVRGIFMSRGNYGHRGRYSYKIVASEVSKVGKPSGNK